MTGQPFFDVSYFEICNACGNDNYGCYCKGSYGLPALSLPPLAHTHEEQQDPFTDQNALRNSYSPEQTETKKNPDKVTTAGAIGASPPVSDDGLPSSLPSRHTLSAQSSRLFDQRTLQPPSSNVVRPRPPSLLLRPRSVESRHRLSDSSSLASISRPGEDLVSSRDSPKRQTTVVHIPVYTRSETASLHGADEPIRRTERRESIPERSKRLPSGLPNDYAVGARSSIKGQKQPFPLLSLTFEQEKQPSTAHVQRSSGYNQKHSRFRVWKPLIALWCSKPKAAVLLLGAVFQLSLITLTAAVVICAKDNPRKKLRAGTVIAGILGVAGCGASILCGWAIWCDRLRREDAYEAASERKGSNIDVDRGWNEKKQEFHYPISSRQEEIFREHGSPKRITDSLGPDAEEENQIPRQLQETYLNYEPLKPRIDDHQQIPQINHPEAHNVTMYATRPKPTRASSSGTALASSSLLPSAMTSGLPQPVPVSPISLSGSNRPYSGSPVSSIRYREKLEERLQSREHMEAIGLDGTYIRDPFEHTGTNNPTPQHFSTLVLASTSPLTPSFPTSPPPTSASLSFLQPPVKTRCLTHPPASLFIPSPNSPNSNNLLTPSTNNLTPTLSPNSPNLSPTPPHHHPAQPPPTSSSETSDSSSLRAARTLHSVQKVRVWQKFMVDLESGFEFGDREEDKEREGIRGSRGGSRVKFLTWHGKGRGRGKEGGIERGMEGKGVERGGEGDVDVRRSRTG